MTVAPGAGAFDGAIPHLPVPQGPIRLGGEAHTALFCKALLETHDPYKPALVEAKVLLVRLFLVGERIGMAKGMGQNTKAQDSNFTLNGSKALRVEVTFPELAAIWLAEHDRRLAPCDARLLRPRFVPAIIRLALRIAGKS